MVNHNQQITWINQLKKGNELAAFNLYECYSKSMYNTLIRITGNNAVAEDLLQDAFIMAFKKIDDLKNPEAFAGWMKRIVINKGLEHVRKAKIVYEDIANLEVMDDEEIDDHHIDDQTLHHAIKQLPDGCRTVLCLHLLEGFKHKEIATRLGISESTSKTQFRHAKKLLKNKLQDTYANRGCN